MCREAFACFFSIGGAHTDSNSEPADIHQALLHCFRDFLCFPVCRKEIAEKLEGKMVYVTVLYETLGTIKKTAKTALE